MFKRLRSLFRVLTWRRDFEEGMSEELRFHIEQYTDDLVRSGGRENRLPLRYASLPASKAVRPELVAHARQWEPVTILVLAQSQPVVRVG